MMNQEISESYQSLYLYYLNHLPEVARETLNNQGAVSNDKLAEQEEALHELLLRQERTCYDFVKYLRQILFFLYTTSNHAIDENIKFYMRSNIGTLNGLIERRKALQQKYPDSKQNNHNAIAIIALEDDIQWYRQLIDVMRYSFGIQINPEEVFKVSQ